MYDTDKFLWFFANRFFVYNKTFSNIDFYNFAKACNVKVDHSYCNDFFTNDVPKKYAFNSQERFITSRSLLGPCYVHNEKLSFSPNKLNYNVSKIINELQLQKQNITPEEKLDKIMNYIKFLE